jgi:hypothetical protein
MFETKNRRSSATQARARRENAAPPRTDQALLMVSASEGDSNMLYAAGFFVPDPFIYFAHKKIRYIVMSDLEIDRAKRQSRADRVLSLSFYQRKLRKLDIRQISKPGKNIACRNHTSRMQSHFA